MALVEKNQTFIQMLKLLYKPSKRKLTVSKRTYPRGIENRYKTKLSSYVRPLTDYVNKFLDENEEQLLRGDSKDIRLDAIPGGRFREMINNLQGWISVYMPTVEEIKNGGNNTVYLGLGESAEQLKKYNDKQFSDSIKKVTNVDFNVESDWWENVKLSWQEQNYNYLRNYDVTFINNVNTVVEQAIINGLSVSQLKAQIKELNSSLLDKKCRLLARDQIGKLNGLVTQAQMEEIGLELYVWETSGDERVRSSHFPMDGLLCRWDNPNVYSDDGGKTWKDRPFNAVHLHPGQDIQCRCIALNYYSELIGELTDKPIEVSENKSENVSQSINFTDEFIKNGYEGKDKDFIDYVSKCFDETTDNYKQAMCKLVSENKNSIIFKTMKQSSCFNPNDKTVLITSLDKLSTLRHEIGHFLDHIIGKNVILTNSNLPNFKQNYRFAFSICDEFDKTYQKEVNGMIINLKKKLQVKYGEKPSYYTIGSYLYNLSKTNSNLASTIADMCTAKLKKPFGGHSVSYFNPQPIVKRYFPQLKNETTNSEGFAELCEMIFRKNQDEETLNFINENFPESKKIIENAINEFIKE